MREIKYQAYDPVLGMLPVASIDFESLTVIVNYKNEGYYTLAFREGVPLQYTNRKDKNDKEIYGGDVVEITSNMVLLLTGKPTGNITTTRYRVVYSSEDLIWYVIDNKGDKSRAKFYLEGGDVKIIGNIYENPELKEATG